MQASDYFKEYSYSETKGGMKDMAANVEVDIRQKGA
jgi:hypothetical protein